MTDLLGDLVRFARAHTALTISLVLLSIAAVLWLGGVDSATWLWAFIGLAGVYLAFALIDLRDEFRRREN